MNRRSARTGFFFALGAFLSWGIFPIYFHALNGVSPIEILAHRILWSALFLAIIVTASRRWREYARPFRAPRLLAVYALSTALITSNWLLYIWAVHAARVLEASLGYFVNPLVNVLLGVIFLREHLRPRQILAIAMAGAGVLVLLMRLGSFPWLALALAFTFGGYGLVRKKADVDPIVGLLVETSFLAPLAVLLIGANTLSGIGGLGHNALTTALLLSAGVITSVPLIWFARGVRSLRLSTVGLIQYVTPTLQFFCAVVLFHEKFTMAHALAFGYIWISLAMFSADAWIYQRSLASPARQPLPRANDE